MVALIMNLLGGAVGGNVAGAVLKKLSLGTVGNSIVGILGGGLGGQLFSGLGVLSNGGSAMDIGNIAVNLLSSGAGGAILLAIVGAVKKYLLKK